MLKGEAQREARQKEMREYIAAKLQHEEEQSDLLTLDEAAKQLRVSVSTARRLFRGEPDVEMLRTPGSRRAIMRIPRSVMERILRRMANPKLH
jgi:hypothetical protein